MTPWTQNPEAIRILAELGANPPAKREQRYAFNETALKYTDQNGDGTLREGRPVRTLNRIYREHGDAASDLFPKDPNPFLRWAQFDVEAAIDDAIARAREERAEEDRRAAA